MEKHRSSIVRHTLLLLTYASTWHLLRNRTFSALWMLTTATAKISLTNNYALNACEKSVNKGQLQRSVYKYSADWYKYQTPQNFKHSGSVLERVSLRYQTWDLCLQLCSSHVSTHHAIFIWISFLILIHVHLQYMKKFYEITNWKYVRRSCN